MREPDVSTSATTSRAVLLESFGGPEVLNLREVPAPQAGPGQVRVRVTAAGLNPMDWFMTADADTAVRFGLSLPAGFGTDYAGAVEQVGDGVTGFAPGETGCSAAPPGAHRRKLPDRANPHRGRAPGRPAPEGQGRHRPLAGRRPRARRS